MIEPGELRLALISDIHGNLHSLDAVLGAIQREGVDLVLSLGDVAATGPQPAECLARIREIGALVVMGNTDAWLLDPQPAEAADPAARLFAEVDEWCLSQLSPSDLAYLASFQDTVSVPLGDGQRLLGFHGSPRSNTEIISAAAGDDQLAACLAGFPAAVFAGGHIHEQFVRRFGGATLINPGSVGLPYESLPGGEGARNPPWAEFAIVDWSRQRVRVELRREAIDPRAVREAIVGSGMPYSAILAADWG